MTLALPAVRDVPAVTAAQMAEVDRITVEELFIGVEILMETASRQIAATARAFLGGTVDGKRIVGLVGSGNNGADVAGALRHLASWGALVRAECGAAQERQRETTRRQLARLLAATDSRTATVRDLTRDEPRVEGDLVLDGLLGYSSRGEPRGLVAKVIEAANAGAAPVIAVDLPSGIDPDSGTAAGVAIRAAATVTLALAKTGLLTPTAAEFVGDLVLADIGIPHAAFARIGVDTSRLFRDGDLVRILR